MTSVRHSSSAAARRRVNRQLERLARAERRALLEQLRLIRRQRDVADAVLVVIVYSVAIVACAISMWIVLAVPYINHFSFAGITFK